MRSSTLVAIKAVFDSDPARSLADREIFLRTLGLTGGAKTDEPGEKILSFEDAAKRIGRTKATVHLLAKRGVLKKILFPGSTRCAGVLASDLDSFLKNSATQVAV